MKIKIHRQPTYDILKVIIPLCLIVTMSWLPRWIDPEQIGTNIGVSTSAFLTLVAYLFAITVLLPRVSYITRIDRFILLSTLTVFAGLIRTVVNTVLIRGENASKAERIDHLVAVRLSDRVGAGARIFVAVPKTMSQYSPTSQSHHGDH